MNTKYYKPRQKSPCIREYVSDRDGNNKRSPSSEDVSIIGHKYRYTVNGGGTDIAINTIDISYIVK